jgi:uncharacterized paraquat-inducible protein A
MATRYILTARTDCEHCAGTGRETHPTWTRFYRQLEAGNATEEKTVEWFIKNTGYDDGRLPSEEIQCTRCGGMGYEDVTIELRAALDALTAEDEARERRKRQL